MDKTRLHQKGRVVRWTRPVISMDWMDPVDPCDPTSKRSIHFYRLEPIYFVNGYISLSVCLSLSLSLDVKAPFACSEFNLLWWDDWRSIETLKGWKQTIQNVWLWRNFFQKNNFYIFYNIIIKREKLSTHVKATAHGIWPSHRARVSPIRCAGSALSKILSPSNVAILLISKFSSYFPHAPPSVIVPRAVSRPADRPAPHLLLFLLNSSRRSERLCNLPYASNSMLSQGLQPLTDRHVSRRNNIRGGKNIYLLRRIFLIISFFCLFH